MKMTVSYEWLCDLVDGLNLHSPHDVGLALTALGAETEAVSTLSYGKNTELGQITKIEKLDKLSAVTIQTPVKTYKTVSNSPNLKEGHYVIFVPAGLTIFGDKIVQAKEISGITTEGLLLALENLGIESKSTDIIHLGDNKEEAEKSFKIYTELDAVYTLDIPGNRPDWLSVSGLAQALAIYFKLNLSHKDRLSSSKESNEINISIQSEFCSRYSLRKISSITCEESSILFQKRLLLLGMRPINNIVDMTNIIMLETGQPTHAFDVREIDKEIIVRQAREGERLQLLDEQKVTLTSDDLVICDSNKILALAGIMGGLHSGVQADTKEIYLESAHFKGVVVRRTAKRLGIKTESSLRFEKNISPELVPLAGERISHLLGNGTLISDVYPNPIKKEEIHCCAEDIRKYLGIPSLDDGTIFSIIQKIGCEIHEKEKSWSITPSGLRSDLKIKEDIMEEVARFYGYDNIPATTYTPSCVQLNPEKTFEEKIRPLLRGMGLSEAVTVVFRSPETRYFNRIENITPVPILNPLNTEWTEMRTHLFDGLLGILKHNVTRAFEKNIAFSEIANVFCKCGEDFIEKKRLSFMISYDNSPYETGLNILNNILAYAKLSSIKAKRIVADQYRFLHPLNAFEIMHNDQVIGFFGEIHPELTEQYDLSDKKDFPNPVVCELDFEVLKFASLVRSVVQPLQELPPILRDITLTVSEDKLGLNIIDEIKQKNSKIQEVTFISVFQNEKLATQKMKNISLRLRFEHIQNAEEIDNFIKELLA